MLYQFNANEFFYQVEDGRLASTSAMERGTNFEKKVETEKKEENVEQL